MMVLENGALKVTGALTMDNIGAALAASQQLFDQQQTVVIDLAQVAEVDSAALGVMFEWLRQAKRHKVELKFANLSDNLQSLAKLYGVTELIPVLGAER